MTLRSPAPGSRLVEGEPFTVNASVSDNRQVVSALFFIRQDGALLFQKAFNTNEIASIRGRGEYLAARMRVPTRPETPGVVLEVGVQATDNAGLSTEALLDLTILDDLEPPNVAMAKPEEDFDILPGDSFVVDGVADDNYYIERARAVFTDGAGEDTVIDWETFSRTDRLEQITVPNPGTFGSVIVAERFYMDYRGRVRIPTEFLDRAGETFRFRVAADDRGINTGFGPEVLITILGDTEPPEITFVSPPKVVYDRQPLELDVDITDNVELDSYSIYFSDDPASPLAENADLDVASIHVPESGDIPIDLSAFAPIPAEGKTFTMVGRATDRAGLETVEARLVMIEPDLPPALRVVDKEPETDSIKGGMAFRTVEVTDDYVNVQHPVDSFTLVSSLHGLGAGGARDPTGRTEGVPQNQQPHIDLLYPEAGAASGVVLVNDQPFMRVDAGVLSTYSLYGRSSSIGVNSLAMDFGADVSVSYRISTWSDDACTALVRTFTESPADGVLDIASLDVGSGVTALTVTPVFESTGGAVPDFLVEFRIYLDIFDAVRRYISDGQAFPVAAEDRMVVVLANDDPDTGLRTSAYIEPSRLYRQTVDELNVSLMSPVPVLTELVGYTGLGHAVDRFSLERGPVPLRPLESQTTQIDDLGPELTLISPEPGTFVVPLQRVDIEFEVTDNTDGVQSIALIENRSKVVREISGEFRTTRYTIPL